MKRASFIFVTIAISVSIIASTYKSKVYSSELQKLNLNVESQKQEYLLGEEIQLNIKVSNESSEDILSSDALAKSCAYLRIYVSTDDKTYSEYFGPWFQIEGCEINLLNGFELTIYADFFDFIRFLSR